MKASRKPWSLSLPSLGLAGVPDDIPANSKLSLRKRNRNGCLVAEKKEEKWEERTHSTYTMHVVSEYSIANNRMSEQFLRGCVRSNHLRLGLAESEILLVSAQGTVHSFRYSTVVSFLSCYTI